MTCMENVFFDGGSQTAQPYIYTFAEGKHISAESGPYLAIFVPKELLKAMR